MTVMQNFREQRLKVLLYGTQIHGKRFTGGGAGGVREDAGMSMSPILSWIRKYAHLLTWEDMFLTVCPPRMDLRIGPDKSKQQETDWLTALRVLGWKWAAPLEFSQGEDDRVSKSLLAGRMWLVCRRLCMCLLKSCPRRQPAGVGRKSWKHCWICKGWEEVPYEP